MFKLNLYQLMKKQHMIEIINEESENKTSIKNIFFENVLIYIYFYLTLLF